VAGGEDLTPDTHEFVNILHLPREEAGSKGWPLTPYPLTPYVRTIGDIA
jgi:hypothetical protein